MGNIFIQNMDESLNMSQKSDLNFEYEESKLISAIHSTRQTERQKEELKRLSNDCNVEISS